MAVSGYHYYFTNKASLLEIMPWYEISALVATLRNMRKVNFARIANRKQQLDALNSLDTECPHSEHQRFPLGKRYICESTGDWTRKFQQLRLVLSAKNLAKDPKAKEIPQRHSQHHDTIGPNGIPLHQGFF
ncbi:hypothetical protein HHI36_003317 [Cryptolaemus montrouzieri]|uniref:Uncharacterized protein n=1 Tax=Cryptolaemus montrouzieri TaxID=559131 RepID=A0ABD2PD23_9CUCU